MKVNNINQNFGAQIIMNESFKKALENAKLTNDLGIFNQTVQFINAVQAIKHTDKFDTFEINAQSLDEWRKSDISTNIPFEVKIDGKPYDCRDEAPAALSLFGDHKSSCATAGVIGFAKKFFGSDFTHPITERHKSYNEIMAKVEEHKRQAQILELEASSIQRSVSKGYKKTLDELA